MSRQLPNDSMPLRNGTPQSVTLHPRTRVMGASYSGYSANPLDSLSNQSMVAPFISQSSNGDVFQALSDNTPGAHTAATWGIIR